MEKNGNLIDRIISITKRNVDGTVKRAEHTLDTALDQAPICHVVQASGEDDTYFEFIQATFFDKSTAVDYCVLMNAKTEAANVRYHSCRVCPLANEEGPPLPTCKEYCDDGLDSCYNLVPNYGDSEYKVIEANIGKRKKIVE